MAFGYRPVDRDQVFLLPPSVRDWLPPEHLVWFVLDVVDRLDTSAFHADRRRKDPRGAAAYDPDMLLALLIYAYAHGVRSSRQIARLCEVDVAFMTACGLDAPSHQTLSRFVAESQEAVEDFFGQVLRLCAAAGLVALGEVAIDGTKIAANAGAGANRSRGWVQEQAAKLVGQHVAADAAEDVLFGSARGDELPDTVRKTERRRVTLERALAELDRQDAEQARQQAEQAAKREQQRAERDRADDEGEPEPRGPGAVCGEKRVALAEARLAAARADAEARYARTKAGPQHRQAVPPEQFCRVVAAQKQLEAARAALVARNTEKQRKRDKRKVNLTDPDSRMMKSLHGWVQGYNCQFAVTSDQILLVVRVTQDVNDCLQFQPMMTDAVTAAASLPSRPGSPDEIQVLLADAGYFSVENATARGPDRLIATDKRHKIENKVASDTEADSPVKQQMRERLTSPEGAELYRKRAATVEPVNGQIKDRRGLRQFRRRGLQAVTAETLFTGAVHNLMKLASQVPTPKISTIQLA